MKNTGDNKELHLPPYQPKSMLNTLRGRVTIISISLMIFIAGFVYFSYAVIEERTIEDQIINLIGSQRMRLFEIAYHLNTFSEDAAFTNKEISMHITDFDEIINGLHHGSERLQLIPLAAIISKQDMSKFDTVEAKWQRHKTLITLALSALNNNHIKDADFYKKQYLDSIHSFVTDDINGLLAAVNNDIKSDSKNYLIILVLFFCLLAAVWILIYKWFIKTILKPITKIMATSQKLGKDLNVRITNFNPNTEIGELAVVFNRMAANIESAVKSIQNSAYENALILEAEITKKTYNLNLAIKELKKANTVKSAFLANMSHELKTPLNAVIGFSELIKDGTTGSVNAKQAEYVSYIYKSGVHLLSLVTNILTFSKIESGKDTLSLTQHPLKSLVSDCLLMFHDCKKTHGIKLVSEISNEIELVEVDPLKIKQVMINLVTNAVKFTPDGGHIKISASFINKEGDQYLQVSVQDSGIGIKQEDICRLFTPFEQLQAPLTKQYGGTGLGLALCKSIIEMHGGKIWIESEYGNGTNVIFSLPVNYQNKDIQKVLLKC